MAASQYTIIFNQTIMFFYWSSQSFFFNGLRAFMLMMNKLYLSLAVGCKSI